MKTTIYLLSVALLIVLVSACSGKQAKLPPTSTPTGPTVTPSPTVPPATPTPANPPAAATPATAWRLVWSDEFDGLDGSPVDGQNWSFDIGGGGWGNRELECYTDSTENAYLEQGSLVIRAIKQDNQKCPYTSARLVTRGKVDWLYGRFEVRARLPVGQGVWPAVWMLPADSEYGTWPLSGEIDILELIGKEPARVYGSIHYGAPHEFRNAHYDLAQGTFDQAYHTFALEWEPREIRWYVDSNLYETQTEWFTSSPKGEYPAPFDRRFYLLINLAVGGVWPGYPDEATTFPKELRVDYVRVFTK